jgi:hypothetical protein
VLRVQLVDVVADRPLIDPDLIEARIANLERRNSQASGVGRRQDGRYQLESGAPLDSGAIYSVATIDYLFLGGAGYVLRDRAVSVEPATPDWREPVIAWTRKQRSTQASPLVLRPPPATP